MADGLGGRIVGIDRHERDAGVRVGAQRHRQRDLAEQRDVELVGQALAAALAEDREALAARRGEAGHVLDDAEISRLTLSAIWAERRATFCAASCGVVTIMNVACGSSWESDIETSPVPGGRSISR